MSEFIKTRKITLNIEIEKGKLEEIDKIADSKNLSRDEIIEECIRMVLEK